MTASRNSDSVYQKLRRLLAILILPVKNCDGFIISIRRLGRKKDTKKQKSSHSSALPFLKNSFQKTTHEVFGVKLTDVINLFTEADEFDWDV